MSDQAPHPDEETRLAAAVELIYAEIEQRDDVPGSPASEMELWLIGKELGLVDADDGRTFEPLELGSVLSAARAAMVRADVEVTIERRFDQLEGWRARAFDAEARAARYAGQLARAGISLGAIPENVGDAVLGPRAVGAVEPPAEGTRRWHILEALKRWLLANPGKPVTSEEEAIDFADAIEAEIARAFEGESPSEFSARTERRITINRQDFKVVGRAMWGADLYRLPTPPLDPDYHELFQDTPGDGPDTWISPAQLVDFDQGESFHSTPRRVT